MLRFIPLLIFLTGCYANELEQQLDNEPFFDLAGFIDSEVTRLAEAGEEVTKTVVLNGQREQQRRSDINFALDLRVFRDADINKPAWRDKYTVSREPNRTIYTATDSTMQTQRLAVDILNGVPQRVFIDRKTGTVLSDGRHELMYDRYRGYRIRTQQVNTFGADVDAEVMVEWEDDRPPQVFK